MVAIRERRQRLKSAFYVMSAGSGDQLAERQALAHERAMRTWDKRKPKFYFLPSAWVLNCTERSLPRMQTLRAAGHLQSIAIPLSDAFHGEGIVNRILFVSHRWEDRGQPDQLGVQLDAIKRHLAEHPEIEWVWFECAARSARSEKLGGWDRLRWPICAQQLSSS